MGFHKSIDLIGETVALAAADTDLDAAAQTASAVNANIFCQLGECSLVKTTGHYRDAKDKPLMHTTSDKMEKITWSYGISGNPEYIKLFKQEMDERFSRIVDTSLRVSGKAYRDRFNHYRRN